MATRLDYILDAVKRGELEATIDIDGYPEESVERIIAAAKGRGLRVSRTRGHVLVRAWPRERAEGMKGGV